MISCPRSAAPSFDSNFDHPLDPIAARESREGTAHREAIAGTGFPAHSYARKLSSASASSSVTLLE